MAPLPAVESVETTPSNASQHPVKANRPDHKYRVYDPTGGLPLQTYKNMYQFQTVDYVLGSKAKWGAHDTAVMNVWEAIQLLNTISDESDPDNNIAQIFHCYQTAEKLREIWPGDEYDWVHLTGFIHDLGKVLLAPKWGPQPQWAVVGDTFPVGCQFSEKNVYSSHYSSNPDSLNPKYTTLYGIYEPHCGFDAVHMSWGHDEYLYQVLKDNGCTLPENALYLIRYHSFYPWHREGAYEHLASQKDKEMLPLLRDFSNCDLYSKCTADLNAPEIQAYYQSLVKKYFPVQDLKW